MNDLLLLGHLVITVIAGKCVGCGAARMIFINHMGKTKCAGCARKEAAA